MNARATKLPSGFQNVGGRVSRPRTEGAPADPEKKKDPAAADGEPMACPSCEAEVPAGSKYCPSCGKEMPAAEPADPPPAEPAPKEASAFARSAMVLTNTRSLEAAKGTLVAWKEAAAKATTLGAQLDEKTARLATIERERLLERAVAEGRLEPSQAWTFSVGEDGAKVRSFSAWAGPPTAAGTGQSLEQLAGYIAGREPRTSSPARSFTPAPKNAAPAAAAPPGLNPDFYAAASRQVAEKIG